MRIVSLLPSATEICFALGLEEELVGVTHECDYPSEALSKPRLTRSNLPQTLQHAGSGRSAAIDRHVRANVHAGSSLYALDADLLERLAPDLILTQELCAVCAVSYEIVTSAVKQLRGDASRAACIVSLEPRTLDDVFGTIETVATLAGVAERAQLVLKPLRERVATLRAKTEGLPRPQTLVLEWTDPPMSGGHWTPGLVELAAGTPLLAHPAADSQRLAWESIASADPDAILVAPCGFDLQATREAVAELGTLPEWRALRAVRGGAAWMFDGNAYVNRPGPRLVDTAELFAQALHPDLGGGALQGRRPPVFELVEVT